jgi:hypothetical protein
MECEEEEHHFKISILKNNEEIYSGRLESDSEEAFFKKITELRRDVRESKYIRLKEMTPDKKKPKN